MKVLIVDDEQANRLILQAMLKKGEHEVIEARDGQEAISLFDEHQPDLVLMDVMMPVLDGYEATKAIKARTLNDFTPVIFLTAITDEDALVKCIESGGDDFLTKPYNRTILQAKIAAMERIRLLNHTVSLQNRELAEYHKYIEHEQEVAEKIFSKLMQQGESDLPMVNTYRESAATFNGDIFLVSRQPSGVVYLMVGDFTGHGLAAALGALPATQIFYAMCNKGFSIEEIIAEINTRLKNLLPTGIFLAASLIQFDPNTSRASIWHGGLPEIIMIQGKDNSLSKINSTHLPLGVVSSEQMKGGVEYVTIDKDDRFVIYSDGLIETFNSDDKIYGQQRLDELISEHAGTGGNTVEIIIEDLNQYRQGGDSHDDVTIVEFICNDEFFDTSKQTVEQPIRYKPKDWELSFLFKHELLGRLDPLPTIMAALRDIQGLHKYKEDIFLILSELYVNALDYGVLGLDSKLKTTKEGFDDYYVERQRRLENLNSGWVKVTLSDQKNGTTGCLTIVVEDSGKGFRHDQAVEQAITDDKKHGRGLALVNSIGASLTYNVIGNRAEVLYEWS